MTSHVTPSASEKLSAQSAILSTWNVGNVLMDSWIPIVGLFLNFVYMSLLPTKLILILEVI